MAREQQDVTGEEDQDTHLIPVSISTLLGLTRLARVGKKLQIQHIQITRLVDFF
jgi:hypothetical protein